MVEATETPCGVIEHVLGSDEAGAEHIIVPAGGVAQPTTHEALDAGDMTVKMNGREVFKFATRVMGSALGTVLKKAEMTTDDVDLFIPHQANARIIEYAAQEYGLPPEKVVMNVDRYGNTSAASVPLALAEAFDDGRAQPGDRLALVAFGAGLTWASAVVQLGRPWSRSTPLTGATPLSRRSPDHRASRSARSLSLSVLASPLLSAPLLSASPLAASLLSVLAESADPLAPALPLP